MCSGGVALELDGDLSKDCDACVGDGAGVAGKENAWHGVLGG